MNRVVSRLWWRRWWGVVLLAILACEVGPLGGQPVRGQSPDGQSNSGQSNRRQPTSEAAHSQQSVDSPVSSEQSAIEGSPATVELAFSRDVRPLLKAYCTDCHGARTQKAERRFDGLDGTISDSEVLVDYQDILDQLNLSAMPPEDSRQPSEGQRQRAVRWLTKAIDGYHKSRTDESRGTVLRRLNSREYRNTVRDLFGFRMEMFDPAKRFPRDQTVEHLDNVGESLVTSGYLLARYLDAADQVVERALTPRQRPEVKTWTFRDNFRQQPEIDQVHGKTNGFRHMTLYDVVGADKHEGAYGPILAFRQGVPVRGFYDLRLRAEAVNRQHPYDPKFLGTDPSEPLRLGIVPGDDRVGALHKPQPIEPLLAELDLADEPQWYTVRVWLDAGYTPRFTFRNGLMDARNLWSQLLRKYADQFPKRTRPGIVEARFNAIKFGKLPQIHLHEIEITGPIYDEWPTPAQRVLLGDQATRILETGEMSEDLMRRQLSRLGRRVYRRPVEDAEVDRLMQVARQRWESGRPAVDAYADAVRAMLCSPSFLYLDEGDAPRLSDWALASRLSYFLWASTPDEELLRLAEEGRLHEPNVLSGQVDRMLAHQRSEAFIRGFLDSWLTLRDLGSMPPDRSQFRDFYHYDLGTAMRRETELFTREILTRNLAIEQFLDADFTFVNKRLAQVYGLEATSAFEFEKVESRDPRRRGLLGQASVLTVTANGIDTSPVTRGVWMLENILGTPPSPPPPDVEPLDPDIRGAKTIREQLQKHRDVPSCAECHRKIDPLGFALENFDAIGRWRSSYGRGVPIDASGQLPGGRTFQDVSGLRAILLARQDQFAHALTDRLLAYALGRQTVSLDRPAIDQIVSDLHQRGDGFADLIKLIVLSDPFGGR